MREDLPCDEPLPKLWSICLAPGGGPIVDGAGPCSDDFDVLEPLQVGGASRCWRVRSNDDSHHVLCETRFVVPERLAIPQLGRLRELLLREARLLDTLFHSCVVPLESGWLEQRTGLEDHHGCASAVCCGYPSSGRARNRAEGVWEGSASTPAVGPSGHGEDGSASCRDHSNVRLSMSGEDGLHGEEVDIANFLLRSWVPLTLEDVDGDDDDDDAHQDEDVEVENGRKHVDNLEFGGLEQLRWGGDDKTNWRGTAEPKSTSHRTALTPAADTALVWEAPNHFRAATAERPCSCAFGGRLSTNDDCGQGFRLRRRERTLSLASYLLLPDWLPLSVWFETEFEPRTASSDAQDGAVTTRAVTASDEWALVWQHLMSMFVQVVRGVEHLHTQGLIHNNVSPCSVWVATDGRCCVGNLSQAAPPGYRRPPSPSGQDATRHRHYASPERRQGRRVGAKSDLYSLGVLMLEFWRNYILSRGLEELCLAGDDGLVERIKSSGATAQPDHGGGVLDAVLVKSMLAEEPSDRPDCFEVIDGLVDES